MRTVIESINLVNIITESISITVFWFNCHVACNRDGGFGRRDSCFPVLQFRRKPHGSTHFETGSGLSLRARKIATFALVCIVPQRKISAIEDMAVVVCFLGLSGSEGAF